MALPSRVSRFGLIRLALAARIPLLILSASVWVTGDESGTSATEFIY
jgi:hypothetical protein